jgi:hypothetical protein
VDEPNKYILGYTYGDSEAEPSPVSEPELASLKVSASFTDEDERYLVLARTVLKNQTHAIVSHWRSGIIAAIPQLARHSRSASGDAAPEYLASSNARFEQWILDTCFRKYDQDWLDYQHEIALRHTSIKKNVTDNVESSPYVPLRDIIAFSAVMNETIKPYLMTGGHSEDDVNRMHSAWCKSIQMQLALWAFTYANASLLPNEW